MKNNRFFLCIAVTVAACLGFFGLPVVNQIDLKVPAQFSKNLDVTSINIEFPDWLIMEEAEASPYRRSVRRTSRRTSRRTTAAYNSYPTPYYAPATTAVVATGAAVGAATTGVGTIVPALPAGCTTVVANGIAYQSCSGVYFLPSGSQWIIVNAP